MSRKVFSCDNKEWREGERETEDGEKGRGGGDQWSHSAGIISTLTTVSASRVVP